MISGKKKFVHVEVGTLFTFLFFGRGREYTAQECV